VRLVSNATPHFIRVDILIRIQCASLLQKNVGGLRVSRVSDAAVVNGTHSGALRFIKVTDAFSATIMRDDVDVISLTLTVSYVIPLAFSIAPRFENGLVGTLR
jgi:hypothetical protein